MSDDLPCPRSSGSIEDKYASGGIESLTAPEKQQLYATHSIEDLRDIAHNKPLGYYRHIDARLYTTGKKPPTAY